MRPFSATHTFSLRYLVSFSTLLCGVLVALNANAGFDQNRTANALAWCFQVPLAFLVLFVCWQALSRWCWSAPTHAVWRIIASAVLASMLMSPLFLGLELAIAQLLNIPYSDPWPQSGSMLVWALLEEWRHMLAPFVAVWLLVALPVLHRISPIIVEERGTPFGDQPAPAAQHSEQIEEPGSVPMQDPVPVSKSPPLDHTTPTCTDAQALPLPAAIRGDWLAAKSELQYVRVWTSRGHTLVLGSLTHIEQFYGASGLRVHKSWWVACDAVEGVNKQRSTTHLKISNGLLVPVSRRKQQAVLAQCVDQKL